MLKLTRKIKTVVGYAGALAIMVLLIWGINACREKSEREYQKERKANQKLLSENIQKRHELYLKAEKNLKDFTEELNKMVAYLQEHPGVIEELKKYDWTKLEKHASSLETIYKIGFNGVKSHLEKGSLIELYKRLISESESIKVLMAAAHFDRRYFDGYMFGDPFYLGPRSVFLFSHRLTYSIMLEMGYDPLEGAE